MRRWAFVIAVLGLFVLFLFFNSGAKDIECYENLQSLGLNSVVDVRGLVVEEKLIFGGTKILVLENGVELICDCPDNFEGEEIFAEGIVSEFEKMKQISVLRIGKV